MLNEKQVRIGAKCRLALCCVTWQSAPPESVCLDFVLCVMSAQKLGGCQFMKPLQTPPCSRRCVHTLCSSCLHRLHRRSLSSYSAPLSLSPDHLSITPPRLLICPSSVSHYRTRSTYSGYTFIHSPQTRCSLDAPGLDMQPK